MIVSFRQGSGVVLDAASIACAAKVCKVADTVWKVIHDTHTL